MLVAIAITTYVCLLAAALMVFISAARQDMRALEAELEHLRACDACRGDGECPLDATGATEGR